MIRVVERADRPFFHYSKLIFFSFAIFGKIPVEV